VSGTLAFVAAVGLLIVPISYERIAAHDVELVVSGPMAPSLAKAVTAECQAVLGAHHVAVTRQPGATGEGLKFVSRIPAREGVNVEAAAQTLAKALERSGHATRATVVPRRERVSGSVYAFARDRVIRIRGKGRTALEIEAELRRRLEEEDLTDARVSVTDERGMRRIQVERPEADTSTPATLGIGLDGAMGSTDAKATRFEVKRIPTGREGVIFHAEVTWQGRTVVIDVPHSETMSEAVLAREVESRLKAAGFDGTVSVGRGTLRIEVNR
jgi:hypothetical protein